MWVASGVWFCGVGERHGVWFHSLEAFRVWFPRLGIHAFPWFNSVGTSRSMITMMGSSSVGFCRYVHSKAYFYCTICCTFGSFTAWGTTWRSVLQYRMRGTSRSIVVLGAPRVGLKCGVYPSVWFCDMGTYQTMILRSSQKLILLCTISESPQPT